MADMFEVVDYVRLGQRISETRKQRSIKQMQLASMIGIKASNLSNIERGTLRPSLDTLLKISSSLNVTIDYLLSDSEEISKAYLLEFEILPKLQECSAKEIKLANRLLEAVMDYNS